MANERSHMNTQGESRLRQAIAVNGKTKIGSQPRTPPEVWGLVIGIAISLTELRPKRKQCPPQPLMPLRKMQVEHLIRFDFGADHSHELFFLLPSPRA